MLAAFLVAPRGKIQKSLAIPNAYHKSLLTQEL